MRNFINSINKNFRRVDSIVWLVIALVFFLGNHFTLLVADDIYYKFVCGSVEVGIPERVTNFVDLWHSFWGHFSVMNGRAFLNVFLLQSALNLIPIWLFNILNTLVWLALTYIIAKQVDVKQKSEVGVAAVITAALLFMLCPVPYETLFWKAGAVNYLWSSLTLMLTMYVFVQEKPSLVGTSLLCLWLGVMHEGFCIPFIVFALMDAVIRRSLKRVMFAGFIMMGCSLQLLNTSGSRDVQAVLSLFSSFGLWRVFDFMESLTTSVAFMVLTLCVVVWLLRDWKAAVAYIQKRYQYFILLLLYMGMLIIIGHASGPRKFMPVHVVSVLLLVDLLMENVKYKISTWIWLGAFSAFATFFFMHTLWPNYQKVSEEIDIIQSSENGVVMAAASPVRIFDATGFEDFYIDYSLYYRVPFQKVYDVKTGEYPIIQYALPESIYKGVYISNDYCVEENELKPDVFLLRDEHVEYRKKQYVVIRCKDSEEVVDKRIAVSFVHEEYPVINGVMDKLRKPKTVFIEKDKVASFVSVYGAEYVIVDVGWPKFYKVAGISIL